MKKQKKKKNVSIFLKIPWKTIAGFLTGIMIFICVVTSLLYFYSKDRFENIGEGFRNLFNLEIKLVENLEDFGDEYYIEVQSVDANIVGDHIVQYSLSEGLLERCKTDMCKVIPEVSGIESEKFKVAGPTMFLERLENGDVYEAKAVKGVLAEIKSESFKIRIVVRIFSSEGVFQGDVLSGSNEVK